MNEKHGHSKSRSPTYLSWLHMRDRCLKPHNEAYPYYGGRGIKICRRWESFSIFLADMGERPAGTSLDRKRVNGNYTPSNCRWATTTEQNRNTRGVRLSPYKAQCIREARNSGMSAAYLAAAYGVSIRTIYWVWASRTWT